MTNYERYILGYADIDELTMEECGELLDDCFEEEEEYDPNEWIMIEYLDRRSETLVYRVVDTFPRDYILSGEFPDEITKIFD